MQLGNVLPGPFRGEEGVGRDMPRNAQLLMTDRPAYRWPALTEGRNAVSSLLQASANVTIVDGGFISRICLNVAVVCRNETNSRLNQTECST